MPPSRPQAEGEREVLLSGRLVHLAPGFRSGPRMAASFLRLIQTACPCFGSDPPQSQRGKFPHKGSLSQSSGTRLSIASGPIFPIVWEASTGDVPVFRRSLSARAGIAAWPPGSISPQGKDGCLADRRMTVPKSLRSAGKRPWLPARSAARSAPRFPNPRPTVPQQRQQAGHCLRPHLFQRWAASTATYRPHPEALSARAVSQPSPPAPSLAGQRRLPGGPQRRRPEAVPSSAG